MTNLQPINSSQFAATADDVPRFDSAIDTGLRAYQFKKNCRVQVCVGNHLIAIAYLQSRFGNQAALLLEFESMHSNLKRCIIRREDLARSGGKKIFTNLLARGYQYDLKHQETILDYLSGLGAGLPQIMADEQDRIGMDLEDLAERARFLSENIEINKVDICEEF